jgi:hypothetical protein
MVKEGTKGGGEEKVIRLKDYSALPRLVSCLPRILYSRGNNYN